MAEEELSQDNFLWNDVESWSFPNLDGDEHGKSPDNNSGGLTAKDDEEAPPPAAKGKKRSSAARGDAGGGESDDHELHIWTERERRKKMRNMFANLHALLPHIPPKADKSTIVDEAVKYIKKLQETQEELQRRKLERVQGIVTHNPITQQRLAILSSREAFLAEQGSSSSNFAVTLASPNPMYPGPEYPAVFKTWTSPNVILNVCGKDAHISVCTVKKPGLLSTICFVTEKHSLEVVSAQVSSDCNRCMYMLHTRANVGSNQFLQAFPVEEIYKQAAAEIMLWVNS